MPFLVKWSLVLAKGRDGLVEYFYEGINPVIPWLSDEDAERLIGLGAVEALDGDLDGDCVEVPPVEPDVKVVECVAALDGLALLPSCGAPTARDALRAEGWRFGNEVIAASVRVRKARLGSASAAVPDTTTGDSGC